jgi:hypothetical protein
VCTYFEWDSLFSRPLRTTLICSILILFFRKSNKKLVEWMKENRISVGKTLLIYCIVFGISLLWLHVFSIWFFSGYELEIKTEQIKSPLAGFFSNESLKNRISLLIWGWWIIWIPWMSSVVARASVGFSVIRAWFQASLFPLLFFIALLPKLLPAHWVSIANAFQSSLIRLGTVLIIFMFMGIAWGKLYDRGDVSRGMMLPIGRLSRRSLTEWMSLVITWLICYIPGWFILGWLLMQLMVTLGGIFMTVVIAFFMVAWISSLIGFSKQRKAIKI